MVNINDRTGVISGLINNGIKRYFKNNPVKDNTELLEKMNEKLDELEMIFKNLSEKPNGETVIELDTK